jgi:hypothetical protein
MESMHSIDSPHSSVVGAADHGAQRDRLPVGCSAAITDGCFGRWQLGYLLPLLPTLRSFTYSTRAC